MTRVSVRHLVVVDMLASEYDTVYAHFEMCFFFNWYEFVDTLFINTDDAAGEPLYQWLDPVFEIISLQTRDVDLMIVQ